MHVVIFIGLRAEEAGAHRGGNLGGVADNAFFIVLIRYLGGGRIEVVDKEVVVAVADVKHTAEHLVAVLDGLIGYEALGQQVLALGVVHHNAHHIGIDAGDGHLGVVHVAGHVGYGLHVHVHADGNLFHHILQGTTDAAAKGGADDGGGQKEPLTHSGPPFCGSRE